MNRFGLGVWGWGWAWMLCGASLFGCFDPSNPPADDTDDAPPSDLPPLEWTSERVELGTELVDEVCLGTLALLDRDVKSIETELELEPGSERIPFFVLPDIQEYCGGAAGCVSDDRVFAYGSSFIGVHHHELVHARILQTRPGVKPFFEEGLATALAGSGVYAACLATETCAGSDIDQLLAITSSFELKSYMPGGDMVYGMLLNEGAAAMLAFIAEINRDMPPADVRALYTDHFDASIDSDFESYKRGVFDDHTPAQLGCVAPPAPQTDDGEVLLAAAMECGLPNVINDFGKAQQGERDHGVVELTFFVEPQNAGAFEFAGSHQLNARLSVFRCNADNTWLSELGPWAYGRSLIPADTLGRQLFLGPGLHKITWRDQFGATLDVVLAPPCTYESQDCPAGEQCTIWNRCEPEVEQPAALGEACDQAIGGPLACAAGSRCLGGLCIAECDATLVCPSGQGCTRTRVCGPDCDLLAQDCELGFSCLPTEDLQALTAGRGQCIPAGPTPIYGGCDVTDATCGAGLSCEEMSPAAGTPCDVDDSGGCCLPYCDPALADPGCPAQIPNCDPILDGAAGICRN